MSAAAYDLGTLWLAAKASTQARYPQPMEYRSTPNQLTLGHHAKIIVPMTENKQLLEIACVIGLVLIYYSSQRSFGIPCVMKQHAVLQVYGYRMQLAGKSSELSTLHSMHNTYTSRSNWNA